MRGRVVGFVLAGGQSRRMGGGDKGLLPFGGATLIGRVADALARQVDVLAIGANGDPERFAALGLPVVADEIEGLPGPLAGIHAGMGWARAQGAQSVLVCAGDMPFLPADLAARLCAGAGPERARVALAASAGRVHPAAGLWSVDLREGVAEALARGERRLRDVAFALGAETVEFAPAPDGGDPFDNVNTPEDLERALRRLAGGHA